MNFVEEKRIFLTFVFFPFCFAFCVKLNNLKTKQFLKTHTHTQNFEMAVDPEAQRRREECERKARRGEMDPRLEFVFQLLMDGTQLPRHQIMDHIFEGDMVNNDLIESEAFRS